MWLYWGENFSSFISGAGTHTLNFQAFLHPEGEEKNVRKEMVKLKPHNSFISKGKT